MIKRVTVLTLLWSFLIAVLAYNGAVPAKAIIPGEDTAVAEGKIYCNAKLDDEFANDRILVVLTNQASLLFRDYTINDFTDIDCISVSDMSSSARYSVQQTINYLNDSVSMGLFVSDSLDLRKIEIFNQILLLRIKNGSKEKVLQSISMLQTREDILYAGPDYQISLVAPSTNDAFANAQWAISAIDVDDAWDIIEETSQVKVGIIDSGIDGSHPDLVGKVSIEESWDFIAGTGGSSMPTDTNGHGTHVSGIIAATPNNTIGIAGICTNIELVSLRVFDDNNNGYNTNIIAAINYAGELDIPIINFSAACKPGWAGYDFALLTAIQNYDGLFICGAGNDGENCGATPVFPASYTADNILSVGASDENGELAEFSNYGGAVDVLAPGVSILSCFPRGICTSGACQYEIVEHHSTGYHYISGTSMATPYVTGIAALILSENPNLSAIQVKNKIMDSCDTNSLLSAYCVTGGIVNAYKSVLGVFSHTVVSVTSTITTSISPGEYRWYRFTAPASGNYIFCTEGELDTIGELYGSSGLINYCDDLESQDEGSESDYNFYFVQSLSAGETVYLRVTIHSGESAGTYTLKVRD